jgi:hypothetical protein
MVIRMKKAELDAGFSWNVQIPPRGDAFGPAPFVRLLVAPTFAAVRLGFTVK